MRLSPFAARLRVSIFRIIIVIIDIFVLKLIMFFEIAGSGAAKNMKNQVLK